MKALILNRAWSARRRPETKIQSGRKHICILCSRVVEEISTSDETETSRILYLPPTSQVVGSIQIAPN